MAMIQSKVGLPPIFDQLAKLEREELKSGSPTEKADILCRRNFSFLYNEKDPNSTISLERTGLIRRFFRFVGRIFHLSNVMRQIDKEHENIAKSFLINYINTPNITQEQKVRAYIVKEFLREKYHIEVSFPAPPPPSPPLPRLISPLPAPPPPPPPLQGLISPLPQGEKKVLPKHQQKMKEPIAGESLAERHRDELKRKVAEIRTKPVEEMEASLKQQSEEMVKKGKTKFAREIEQRGEGAKKEAWVDPGEARDKQRLAAEAENYKKLKEGEKQNKADKEKRKAEEAAILEAQAHKEEKKPVSETGPARVGAAESKAAEVEKRPQAAPTEIAKKPGVPPQVEEEATVVEVEGERPKPSQEPKTEKKDPIKKFFSGLKKSISKLGTQKKP